MDKEGIEHEIRTSSYSSNEKKLERVSDKFEDVGKKKKRERDESYGYGLYVFVRRELLRKEVEDRKGKRIFLDIRGRYFFRTRPRVGVDPC